MDTTLLISAFLTLFVIIDPIAVAPLFMALTTGMDPARRRAAAFRAILVAAAVLTLFGLFGEALLRYAGISLDAFRISGGVLLFLIAVEMLFEKRTSRRSNQAQTVNHPDAGHPGDDDPAVFPIAVPLVAGPGAMATMVLLASQDPGWAWRAAILGVTLAVLAITLTLFLMAPLVDRLAGRSGINVLTRLFGILLAALAVQIVLDGLGGYGLSPTTG
ncbi:MarC family protein [Frigidibacter sp. ROC022]|uniref:MarC family protein n=1 Tax=Frigidibacter sp. ROC022 TaxID=2971796 RepID=UPI00215A6EE9|nr:MarC family protein [Frigidibacter sp. ROC022]MCR8725638.1 MarC family protein [Frigidibacter sp. ROC022]